ncbi:MAG: N-acetylglucosamine kinase [Bacteroidia bacterium]|nr:N-acetylglucosamine kinase [Bacteroidia bacterium]MBT8267657.1 N-acetylglucosamine kinase [Bacteroidia bacterium]NNF81905.1 N-acetylglucosamine kinase [Flavobacteriaceae bacterium]NNK69548.1 N-acetylglucosamine kinase [Flavobacteriaceae bacterium]NNL80269.1 N-acetylglucosamine kinase [Flavobacteriaceae bacterium]
MIFIVDSGSTKCDWLAIDSSGKQLLDKQRTTGMNPAILSPAKLEATIRKNPVLIANKNIVTHVFFYGAGCGTEKPRLMLDTVLSMFFPNAKVDVKEDTYAAVYATVGHTHEPAVVCIMGTGSNCSYFDGDNVHQRVASLGYSVMDDASGNYFGRRLIRDYYFKHMPDFLRVSLAEKYNMDSDFIKFNLYKQPNPNAYLAKFAEFMFLNKDSEYIHELIKSGIREFAKNMIFQFKDELNEIPVHFAGSIAYFSQDEIKEVADEMGFRVGVFERRPIEGLVRYHVASMNSAS